MSNVKFELKMSGLNQLMKGSEMQEKLDKAGAAVAAAAGEGYGYRTHVADFAALCNVYPDTDEARRENLASNTLLIGVGKAGLPTKKP